MPIYEYRCSNCQRRVTMFVQGLTTSPSPSCNWCGSKELTRLFSTFAVHRSDMAVYDDILADPRLVKGLEQNDSRALAEWNRRMSRGLDEEVAPEHQEMLERLEAGQPVAEVATRFREAEEEEG